MLSHFFAYLERLRWIKRWGLKRNTIEENVMEHSWQVATIAHALAVIHNVHYSPANNSPPIDANAVATAALYHDVSEIITGDLPTPIKYHSKRIEQAYKAIEEEAEQELLNMLPSELRSSFAPLLIHEKIPPEYRKYIKAADIISAFLKCQAERKAGNKEFEVAEREILQRLRNLGLPEAEYFMGTFVDSYSLTLDELLSDHDQHLKR